MLCVRKMKLNFWGWYDVLSIEVWWASSWNTWTIYLYRLCWKDRYKNSLAIPRAKETKLYRIALINGYISQTVVDHDCLLVRLPCVCVQNVCATSQASMRSPITIITRFKYLKLILVAINGYINQGTVNRDLRLPCAVRMSATNQTGMRSLDHLLWVLSNLNTLN